MLGKRLIKKLAASVGITLSRQGPVNQPKIIGSFHYEQAFPTAGYAPWLADERFSKTFERIRSNTLVDRYRCYELWELVGQVGHLPGSVLEVGVWRGGTGCLLASNTSKRIVLCDTFSGVVKASAKDTAYRGGEHSDTSREIVEKLAADLGVRVDIRQGIFPDDFPELAVETFAFVHIGVDVYESAKQVLACVWPQMPRSGIVVFDDYGFETCDGITKLINELRGQPDKTVIHNLNGHAVMIKK